MLTSRLPAFLGNFTFLGVLTIFGVLTIVLMPLFVLKQIDGIA